MSFEVISLVTNNVVNCVCVCVGLCNKLMY